jgi:signal peptidase I
VSRERSDLKGDGPKNWRSPHQGQRKKTRRARVAEYLVILAVAFVLIFGLVRPFVLEPFWIPSESMLPTLEVGDRVFVNKFIYRFSEPQRGDIVVFKSLEGEDEDLIKRIIAVPGDRVRVANGVPRVNGERQEQEPYVKPQFPDGSDYGPIRVRKGEVFVMGDNRGNSRDSRFFGPVPIEDIEGEAFFRFWPPSRIGLL